MCWPADFFCCCTLLGLLVMSFQQQVWWWVRAVLCVACHCRYKPTYVQSFEALS